MAEREDFEGGERSERTALRESEGKGASREAGDAMDEKGERDRQDAIERRQRAGVSTAESMTSQLLGRPAGLEDLGIASVKSTGELPLSESIRDTGGTPLEGETASEKPSPADASLGTLEEFLEGIDERIRHLTDWPKLWELLKNMPPDQPELGTGGLLDPESRLKPGDIGSVREGVPDFRPGDVARGGLLDPESRMRPMEDEPEGKWVFPPREKEPFPTLKEFIDGISEEIKHLTDWTRVWELLARDEGIDVSQYGTGGLANPEFRIPEVEGPITLPELGPEVYGTGGLNSPEFRIPEVDGPITLPALGPEVYGTGGLANPEITPGKVDELFPPWESPQVEGADEEPHEEDTGDDDEKPDDNTDDEQPDDDTGDDTDPLTGPPLVRRRVPWESEGREERVRENIERMRERARQQRERREQDPPGRRGPRMGR